jgi:hypothetical protein
LGHADEFKAGGGYVEHGTVGDDAVDYVTAGQRQGAPLHDLG